MSGIPVFSAGTSLQSSGASVSAQIPADSAGMLPLFVRVTATAAGYFKLSQDGASAAVGDLLIQPSDGLILKTCGLSQFSFVSQSGASVVTVTPIDVGGIKYPTNIFTPAALFATGVNGAWYDPSDFSTLFQDAAGTTPVTAVGQPVGLMLDKSKGLVLGSELIPSTISSISGAGWTTNGTSITATSSTASGTIALTTSTSTTKFYQVTFTASALSGATSYMVFSSGVAALTKRINAAKTYSFIVPGQGTAAFEIAPYEGTAFSVTISNISVRELPGNHAFNSSGNSANFPVLQQDGTGRCFLAFNGVNQWLQTNSIDFTYGDKMFVSAGVRKLSDAALAMIVELSASVGSNNGAFWLLGPRTASPSYEFSSKGTIQATAPVNTGYAAPISNVVAGIGDISGDLTITRVNGTQAAISTADQGTGNFGNYPLYIGARAGSSLWFNGRLYGLVVAGKQASASEIASTEAWLNQKTGAY